MAPPPGRVAVLSPLQTAFSTTPSSSVSRPLSPSPLSPFSATSSRSTSPIPQAPSPVPLETGSACVGLLSDGTYSRLLPSWRDKVRRKLVASLEREMPYLQWVQRFRTPALDEYFVKTSLLGTHSFFMICVPMPFWFGHADIGRGLLYVLAGGGYTTSVVKDLFCVPRPFAPPLARLSVGNHALEYGFPSTHSSTTVSMALYFGELLYRRNPELSMLNLFVYAFLAIISFSVVFGRIYTGMHSMVDVSVGSIMGAAVWFGYWVLEDAIEKFTLSAGWAVTAIVVPTTLFLVFVHPAPAEDCPCFEDAVAFLSVAASLIVGRNWYTVNIIGSTVGSEWGTPLQSAVWSTAVLAKLVSGVLTIFCWRLVAKEVCHTILPPIFRFFSRFLLPRRHYLVATEYDAYKKTDGLHPIPSILDLPSLNELEAVPEGEEESTTSSRSSPSLPAALRNRGNGNVNEDPLEKVKLAQKERAMMTKREHTHAGGAGAGSDDVRRDADVLTKVFVYFGIGWLASIAVPWTFARVGLTV